MDIANEVAVIVYVTLRTGTIELYFLSFRPFLMYILFERERVGATALVFWFTLKYSEWLRLDWATVGCQEFSPGWHMDGTDLATWAITAASQGHHQQEARIGSWR